MTDKTRQGGLQRTAKWLCLLGFGLAGLTVIVFTVTMVYEWIVPPTDMHLLGLLSAALLMYTAPPAAVLLVVGGLTWLGLAASKRS